MVALTRSNTSPKKFIAFKFMIDRYYWLLLSIKAKSNENITIYLALAFKTFNNRLKTINIMLSYPEVIRRFEYITLYLNSLFLFQIAITQKFMQ